jgi:preprotein translocase subunit SecD
MNQYPLWKYLLIAITIAIAALYALPNLYGEYPVVQVSAVRGAAIDESTQTSITTVLKGAGIDVADMEQLPQGLVIKFRNTDDQLQAQTTIIDALGDDFIAALNLVPATPDWLTAINAAPMYLGLDLRGGVHFLMEVDMDAAMRQADERYVSDLRAALRGEKIRYLSIGRIASGGVEIKFRNDEDREKARILIGREYPTLLLSNHDSAGVVLLRIAMTDKDIRDIRNFAVQQNIITLRKRVNELGVAEPVIQRQGDNRIVVQLPGVQDPARAKDILGATATLEFRLADDVNDVQDAVAGRVPVGSRLYNERDGRPILLKNRLIVTGDQIIDASSGIDQQNGSPSVYISLDSKGARKMNTTTKENIGKPMAVVFIERKTTTRIVDGNKIKTSKETKEVINVATIRGQFSKRFQITGLDSTEEARKLALLLRAGALAAPIEIVEERTIGPSLGQDNIDMGFLSVVIGFVLVLFFMVVWYRLFGMVANIALTLNLVLIVAVLSLLQATLTLPGIAGIVLTVGMAVDANVLIFERIREELRIGNSPQASISAGYDKALSTIADANITTLIAALVLYGFGTGPIKGFAITLAIGIVTSMFTAIMGTRAIINLMYGGRRVQKLSI